MVEVNLPAPWTSSPKPDNPLENMKQVESDWDEDLESVDYRARPTNDMRKPKTLMRKNLNNRGMPSCWPRNMREENCPSPQQSPEYIPMLVTPQPNKPSEMRGLLTMERRKRPWDGHNASIKHPQSSNCTTMTCTWTH